jgi:hypothetical protein
MHYGQHEGVQICRVVGGILTPVQFYYLSHVLDISRVLARRGKLARCRPAFALLLLSSRNNRQGNKPGEVDRLQLVSAEF